MIFSSLLFLFRFIPVFFLIYYIVPFRFKNAVLLIGSIIFYAWGEPKFLILIIISILFNYFAGLLIDYFKNKAENRRRQETTTDIVKTKNVYDKLRIISFVLAIIYDLGALFVFKYTNFFIENINGMMGTDIKAVELVLPLGISFYTFQIMSYIIDLYKGKIKVEKSPVILGTYLSMFPQLIAGPIVVYSDVSEKLHERKITLNDIEEGIGIFILGLGSKVIIANNVGMLWDDVAAIGYSNIGAGTAWLSVLAFSLQIYFDFNGYSLMAIGLGKMLGFEFPKNFNFPYISRSLTEFWRRWHITLSTWFREYVYIPLGGNRKGRIRIYVNLFVVWFLTGFWHGAGWNFIFWGLFFFVMLSIEKSGLKKFLDNHNVFSHIYSVILIGLSWMIFAITDIKKLGGFFTRLVAFGDDTIALYYLRNYAIILIIGCILSTPLLKKIYMKNKNKLIGIILHLLILVVSVAYLTDATYNPFLYFRF